MQSGTEVFEDHKSPSSSTDPVSGSTSPHVIRPSLLGGLANRPRSSSTNSNGSNHSYNTRSLSIASLESPRNSIVSIDDQAFKSSTRNNSTTSLVSMSGQPPVTTPTNSLLLKERLLLNSSKLKSNSAILFSDDDEDTRVIKPLHVNSKSRSSSTSSTGNPAGIVSTRKTEKLIVKKDYRFKFKDLHKPKPTLDSKSSGVTSIVDSTPSPMSLTVNENIPKTTIEQNRENFKKKSTLKQPFSNLKRNLIFSKDVRLELLNNKLDFGSRFPGNKEVPENIEGLLKEDLKGDFKKLPIFHTLTQKDQLITKLNRKWNKQEKLISISSSNDVNDDTNNDNEYDNNRGSKRRYSSDNELDY
ncbi:hypothetical protein PSN45_004042 [Yamadazyma tenuis]|uniref:Uncharacterized protein n=1 Tax=Candida tenuis (strain ATCC 10573 / BCRC 21748 / CBS 615 / JCM 9827 / NBRC 10315 / NRRL Y-1498 / VKM Y-70) TaxID=590646 RepID=G3B4W0_CANTC|nr:uncharacterized protein CANTEDRAFT_113905 [Yamadazyma tenuis ATCC 10573]EGV63880.1 hypothetical protein CANTEDRAFT_113905 [Yamadazyma tenuis ATCC 10573]WEJ96503.1 hypothetical protein PSN45_004042 [Yamadazyma tenuis]